MLISGRHREISKGKSSRPRGQPGPKTHWRHHSESAIEE